MSSSESVEQTALACYLSTVVAIGRCMAELCPAVGIMYRDRLLKLPRRLGFDATARALEQSRDAVETDLIEFSRAAGAWTGMGSSHATQLLEHLRETEETLAASADLQDAFLDDLADHIRTSAEVDDEARLRTAFKRYAAGLNAFSRRARLEKQATIDDLRRRREEIEQWLAKATMATFTDPDSGLLNREAAELRIETAIRKEIPFSVVVVSRAGESMKSLGERLAATIRPYDVIFRWSEDQLVTIFEASEAAIHARVQQISAWLGESSEETQPMVSVIEHSSDDSAAELIARIESSRQEVAESVE